MIALTDRGWMIFGAKGALQGPYDTAYEAFQALSDGAAESCSDGACGARPPGFPLPGC